MNVKEFVSNFAYGLMIANGIMLLSALSKYVMNIGLAITFLAVVTVLSVMFSLGE